MAIRDCEVFVSRSSDPRKATRRELSPVDTLEPSSGASPLRPAQAALRRAVLAAGTADDNRGRNIVILDVREQSTFFDYFVVATGSSRRQLHAISEEIDRVMEEQLGDRRLGIEGYEESHWILLDYGDVVIHLFDEQTRSYYDLEGLWGRAKRVPYKS